jgi:hypothetical protein
MQFDHDFGIRCQQLLHVILSALNQQSVLPRVPSVAVHSSILIASVSDRAAVWRHWLKSAAPAKLGFCSVPHTIAAKAVAAHQSRPVAKVFFHTASVLDLPNLSAQDRVTYLLPVFSANTSFLRELNIVSNLLGNDLQVNAHHFEPDSQTSSNFLNSLSSELNSFLPNLRDSVQSLSLPLSDSQWFTADHQSKAVESFKLVLPSQFISFEERMSVQFDVNRLPPPSDQLIQNVWKLDIDQLFVARPNSLVFIEISIAPRSSAHPSKYLRGSNSKFSNFLIAQHIPTSAPAKIVRNDIEVPQSAAFDPIFGFFSLLTNFEPHFSRKFSTRISNKIASSVHLPDDFLLGHQYSLRVQISPDLELSDSKHQCKRSSDLSSKRFEPAIFYYSSTSHESGWKQTSSDASVSFHFAPSGSVNSESVFALILADPCYSWSVTFQADSLGVWIDFVRSNLHSFACEFLAWILLALSHQLFIFSAKQFRLSKLSPSFPTVLDSLTDFRIMFGGMLALPLLSQLLRWLIGFGTPDWVADFIFGSELLSRPAPTWFHSCMVKLMAWSMVAIFCFFTQQILRVGSLLRCSALITFLTSTKIASSRSIQIFMSCLRWCILSWTWFTSPYLCVGILSISLLINSSSERSHRDKDISNIKRIHHTIALLFLLLCLIHLPTISLIQRGHQIRLIPVPFWWSFLSSDHFWTIPILAMLRVCKNRIACHEVNPRPMSSRVVETHTLWYYFFQVGVVYVGSFQIF